MGKRRGWLDLRFLVIVFSVLCTTRAFNIDVSKAVVFPGEEKGSGFGTTAEFLQTSSGETLKVLVGAPHMKVTQQSQSGIYFSCSISEPRDCRLRTTQPQPWDVNLCNYRKREDDTEGISFGEEEELFGQTMAVLNEESVLVCGPMWSDLCYWQNNIIFNIGRCHVVSPLESTSPGYTPYREKPLVNYQKNIDIGYGLQRYMYYGRAQFGFSAASDGKGRAVISSPGFSVSRGGVAVFDSRHGNFSIMTKILDMLPETYLGYSVAVGNFCGPAKFCFAVSDRSVLGAVRVLDAEDYSVLNTILGTQEYASFGYSLCAADVNGDGWSDLLVGAPMFKTSPNDSRTVDDEGRVFVYLSRGEVKNGVESFNLTMTLDGDGVSFARFGSAITSIGDINKDSYLDVAVGAPQEGNGVGAVYVYLGGPQGPVLPYTQKIAGKDFTPALRSFGYYISQPTTALGIDKYPAFAVGCPENDTVVVFRTQRLINAEVRMEAMPNPVAPNFNCRPGLDLNSHRAIGCFEIAMYFGQAAGADEDWVSSVDLDYTLEIDTLVSSDSLRRAILLLQRKDGSSYTASTVRDTVRVSGRRETRLQFTAILREDQINRNRFMPVRLQVAFSLNTTGDTDVTPALNQTVSRTATEEVTFKNECGEDEKCHADLVLTGTVRHEPHVDNYENYNVANYTRLVSLHLQLKNRNETSFATRLTTNITGQIVFKTITDSRARSHFICGSQENTTSGTTLVCNNFESFTQKDTVDITLQFEAASVPFQPSIVTFDVQAMPYYESKENPEGNPSDNLVKLESQLKIVAELDLEGSSSPRVVRIRATDTDTSDVSVQHRLYLRNRGPSFLPATHVNISIPHRDSSGSAKSELLKPQESLNVTIKYEDGRKEDCYLLTPTGGSIGVTNTPPTVPPTESTTTEDGDATTTTAQSGASTTPLLSTTTTNPFGPERPSRRRRRQVDGTQINNIARDGDNDRLLTMDCESYMCVLYQCPLPALQPAEDAEINITVSMTKNALPVSDKVNTLLFVTQTEVANPDHPLFIRWAKPKEMQVQTPIYVITTPGEAVNIWIIIGGVLGGLVLLVIIALIAWKLGFFRRKDRAKLERLKRQSGFYNDSKRQSTKSNKSRSSSTGGSVKEKSAG